MPRRPPASTGISPRAGALATRDLTGPRSERVPRGPDRDSTIGVGFSGRPRSFVAIAVLGRPSPAHQTSALHAPRGSALGASATLASEPFARQDRARTRAALRRIAAGRVRSAVTLRGSLARVAAARAGSDGSLGGSPALGRTSGVLRSALGRAAGMGGRTKTVAQPLARTTSRRIATATGRAGSTAVGALALARGATRTRRMRPAGPAALRPD